MSLLVLLMGVFVVVGVNAACSEVAAVQATIGATNLLEGTVPWLCVPPQGELKLNKLDLSLSSNGVLPFKAQYREVKDTEPTIAIVCEVPLEFAAMLITGDSKLKVDITNLTVTCLGPEPDRKVYFAMKDRVLVGPAPECKKLQITDNGNGTFGAVDYTGTAGPPCGGTVAPASTAAPGSNGQMVATNTNGVASLSSSLALFFVVVVKQSLW
jgi:hypothetical protein